MLNLANWGYALRQPLQNNTCFVNIWRVIAVLLICLSLPVFASNDENDGKLIEYLAQEKVNLTINNHEAKLTQPPGDDADLQQRIQHNAAMRTLVRSKIISLENFLINQRQQQQNEITQLKHLQQAPPDQSVQMSIQERIDKLAAVSEVNKKTIELINDNLLLANQYLDTLVTENEQLDLWEAKINEVRQLTQLRSQINALNQARDSFYQKNIELQRTAKSGDTLEKEARLALNTQSIVLIQYRITQLSIQIKLIKANYALQESPDLRTIQTANATYNRALNELLIIDQSLRKVIESLKQQQPFLTDEQLKQQFANLQRDVVLRLEELALMQVKLSKELDTIQQQLKNQLSARQDITEYNVDSWSAIMNQMLTIPTQLYKYLKTLTLKLRDNYLWADNWLITLFWCSFVGISLLGVGLKRLLRSRIQDKERSRLSGHLYDGGIILLYRNMLQLTLVGLIVITLFLNRLPFVSYQLLINLMLVWIIFRSLIVIARMVLLERVSDASGKDVKLYYRLLWLLLTGGWTIALMVFSHQLPLSLLLQDIFNRLFMLFLLAVSVVAWKSKDILPYLLGPVATTNKRYLRNAITLFTYLLPITLLTTAVIGLMGYINLAWIMSRYQVYLLLLLIGYILLRGLILDGLELLSEWMISSLRNGWLWIEVLLKPLDKLLRVVMILLCVGVIFQLLGWNSDSPVTYNLLLVGRYPFIDSAGVHISIISTLEFILLFFFFMWAAKWTREFSYRWLYCNTKDVGVRNSLSVFTQYALILVGGFITLRVLGLDFSGMSVILGGLAVGMGFGLRDFASNIVGGLMLLIERPVREGDLITIGSYEGRVAHIGIRSMRVSSWDNMEVLIPNAETFNKPFTNWTHQDSIVRTVVPIKVSRADDPTMIQQLILDVLAIIPEVLSEPSPQVFLKQIDEALIEFEVRYFINVDLYSRPEVCSKVLFAINAQFKAAGVKPPIPPLSIELRESEVDHADKKSSKERRGVTVPQPKD